MAPSITRIAYVFNPEEPQHRLFLRAMEAAAPSLGVDFMAAPVHSTVELEATLARMASKANMG